MNGRTGNLRFCIILAAVSAALIFRNVPGTGQTKEEAKAQAESQLGRMTPAEIEKRIRDLGLTKEEAVARAAQLGIPLEQYLSAAGTGRTASVTAAPESLAMATEVAAPPDTARRVPAGTVPLSPSGLPYFGYSIFSIVPAAFEPTATGPVDPEYVIGPGDILRVTMWGQVESQNELTVDKEGRIFMSTVGQVMVSGLTLDQAYRKLLHEMARSYSGLVSKNPTVWLDVTLARLRPKRVFIMGEVKSPGGYTVSSYANVFSSLYSVGGPTVKGSLRDVRVVRGSRVIARVDLYKYLTGADETDDIRVQNNDIIFVPPRGKTVGLRGAVLQPAVYELKDDENLAALLRFAGNLLSTAYTGNAQIDRVKPFGERTGGIEDRIVVDVDLRQVLRPQPMDVRLFDQDEVEIFSVLDFKNNYVTITGPVWRPGRFELTSVGTVRDLVAAAKGVQPKTYLGLAHLYRLNEDLITRRIIPFDLSKTLSDPQYNRRLMPRDSVVVYSTEMTEVKRKIVTIRGEVKDPGEYPLGDNMTLEDLVAVAGGYTEAADRLEAEVSRIEPRGFSGDSLAVIYHPRLPGTFNPPPGANGSDTLTTAGLAQAGRFVLQHRDEVLIKANPTYKLQQNVGIRGDFMYPGMYAIEHRGERLSEILERAGGPTPTSYLGGAQFFRGAKRLFVDFDRAYRDRDSEYDVAMMAGDIIIVPSRPHTVQVTGEVNRPGLVLFLTGESVSDYVDRAGGLTDSAYYAVLTQPTGESRRVNFGFLRSDPEVFDGASIYVTKVPMPPPEEKGESLASTVKDIFAIATSAATIAFIVWQVKK